MQFISCFEWLLGENIQGESSWVQLNKIWMGFVQL